MKYFLIGIVIVVIAGVAIYFLWERPASYQKNTIPISGAQAPQSVFLGSGLKIEDITVGTGDEARVGNTVIVNYIGTLTNGTKFDSSYDRGQTFSFALGRGMVIAGWEQGIPGMRVGGKRKLTIMPSLAYGEAGSPGVIPPNATLIFEVNLVGVQ